MRLRQNQADQVHTSTPSCRLDSKMAFEIPIPPANARLHTDRATYLYMTRRFDEAGRSAGTAIALDSLSATGYVWQAYASALQGEADAAIRAIDRATSLAPTAQYLTVDRAIILGSLGRLPEARGFVEPLASDSTSRDAALIAAALGILGEHDRAFERFDALRGDPRFQNVLRRVRTG
ncbi:MAG TPA: hypothetical protein VMN60_03585 [Longimicrobiales bacterium]|nr:hypothetical protein [Longimicrobiales bacterium]